MNKVTKFIIVLQIVICIFFLWKSKQYSEKADKYIDLTNEVMSKATKNAAVADTQDKQAVLMAGAAIKAENAAKEAMQALKACQTKK